MGGKKRWQDLTDTQKIIVISLGMLQLTLLVAALWDIAKRPADEIKGSKKMWTLAAFVNFVGPIAYFLFGRIPPDNP